MIEASKWFTDQEAGAAAINAALLAGGPDGAVVVEYTHELALTCWAASTKRTAYTRHYTKLYGIAPQTDHSLHAKCEPCGKRFAWDKRDHAVPTTLREGIPCPLCGADLERTHGGSPLPEFFVVRWR